MGLQIILQGDKHLTVLQVIGLHKEGHVTGVVQHVILVQHIQGYA